MTNHYRAWFDEARARRALEKFTDKGWVTHYAENAAAARELLFGTCLPRDVSVGLGGSETLAALNALETLRGPGYRLYDRYAAVDHFEVCRDSLMADYFLTGANALTMNGEMVNIDCSGSRVAAMAYGPRRVIVVAGVNKLVDTLDEAVERARRVAPMNCRRNRHQTLCAETGACPRADGDGAPGGGLAGLAAGCNIPDRMCNHLLITLNAKKFAGKYCLILINEDLGF